MPATLNVNKLTVVHAGSSGMAMSFPDVCKTPTPGGPIPIPYPNIAQSSDTADGSSTVKVDGNPIMLKSSNFRMSSGDEAGSVMGVVSNKIKGKATPVNASFDVKVDGKNVFRLTDPMQTNGGSSSNSLCPGEVQAPLPEGLGTSEECNKVKEKREKKDAESTAKAGSGMHEPHFDAIKNVAADFQVVLYFRQTNPLCKPWIADKHQPKPHRVFKANTIKPKDAPEVTAWVAKFKQELEESLAGELSPAAARARVALQVSDAANPRATNLVYATDGNLYVGVVGEPVGKGLRKPLKTDRPKKYKNKWITGDYDLFQVLTSTPGCNQVPQGEIGFARLKNAINKACKWDAIQHGPQAQWVPSEHEQAETPELKGVSFPAGLKGALATGDVEKKVVIPNRSAMYFIDEKITVIAPGGPVYLESRQDVFEALKCRECEK